MKSGEQDQIESVRGEGARPGLARGLEMVLALGGLAALWPLLLLLGFAVRLTSPGPALFRQARVGARGELFELLKFRTMAVRASGSRVTAAGDRRITPLGRLLRASKLDELPELINILRGDMSFVGPRPEVPDFVDLEDARWRFVLSARPGLTDPVTLRLRDEESLLVALGNQLGTDGDAGTEELYRQYLQPFKLRGYARYLRRRSAARDVKVILATLRAIVDPGRAQPPDIEELLRENSSDA